MYYVYEYCAILIDNIIFDSYVSISVTLMFNTHQPHHVLNVFLYIQ